MDYYLKGIKKDSKIKFFLCDVTKIAKRICKKQETNIYTANILTKAIVLASLISLNLKDKQKVDVILESKSSTFVVSANYKHFIRATVTNSQNKILEEDIDSMIVIKDYGIKEKYSSKVSFNNDLSLEENFNEYFKISEQTPIIISTELSFNEKGNIKNAYGYLLSLFPSYDESDVKEMYRLSKNILEINKDLQIIENGKFAFRCTCNKNKFLKVIHSLGEKEIKSLIKSPNECECICNFCKKKYTYSKDELKKLIK